MRQFIATLILLLSATMTTQAQLLWQVISPSLDVGPSYIFGTYHLMPGSMLDSVHGLDSALRHVDAIYVEIEQDSVNSASTKQLMLQAMLAPADSTLRTLVSPDGYEIISSVIDKYYGSFGVGMSAFEKLTPAGIAVQLQAMQTLPLIGDDEFTNLLDAAIERRAAQHGKPAHSLETVEMQVQLIFGDPLSKQAADLLEMCKHDDVVEQKLAELTTAYRSGQIDQIAAIMEDSNLGGSPEEMDRLVYSRNRRWVQKLTEAMRRQSVMVAVGAGHLPTAQGLLHLLREQGFTVVPVQ